MPDTTLGTTADGQSPLQIMHWREGLAHIHGNHDSAPHPASADLPTASAESRIARERRQWLASYAQFRVYWSTRVRDTIADDHPLQDWITRQRKLHRNKKLMPWKRTLLDAISFPYVASLKLTTPTDLVYARRLHAFYVKHGHYAPTITIGGAGLTRWVRRLRESDGKQGLATGTAESAAAAIAYLRANLPEFSLASTRKVELNTAMGLSFNGYEPGTSAGAPTKLRRDLRERAQGALRYPVMLPELLQAPQAVRAICARAAFYEQALRVNLEGSIALRGTWWLTGADRDCITVQRPPPDAPARGARDEVLRLTVLDVGTGQYQPQRGTYELPVCVGSGLSAVLDYSFCLADQTHRRRHPLDFEDFEASIAAGTGAVVDWLTWPGGHRGAARLVGPNSTANLAFETNFERLDREVQAWRAEHRSNRVANISYADWGYHYKFLEHVVLRARARDIPPSHVERLLALDCTWGKQATPLRVLLVQPASRCHVTRLQDIIPFDYPEGPELPWDGPAAAAARINRAMQERLDAGEQVTVTYAGGTRNFHGARP